MYLAVSAEISEDEIIRRVPRLVKVCSDTHIDTLIRQALAGVQLTHMTSPPPSVPIKLNYQYFSLSQSGASWEAVCRARNLAAFVPVEIPNPQLELLILLPEPL
jgi:type VI secretion system protein ImpJ